MATYGACNAPLCFGGRVYSARLVIADVRRPLFGADFLRQHNLLVDLKGHRLIDGFTFSPNTFSVGIAADHHLALLHSTSNKFLKILEYFPDLLQPTISLSTVLHSEQNYVTPSGPPTHARVRRLSPDKLNVAKREFEEMEQMGIRGYS